MEFEKIINLLGNTTNQASIFRTKEEDTIQIVKSGSRFHC